MPALGLRAIVRRFWPYMRAYRRRVTIVLALVVIAPLLETATIWMYKLVVDKVVVPHDLSELVPIGGALALFTLAQSVAGFADQYLASWVAERFLRDLRAGVFSHLHGLSQSFFEQRRLGDLLARLTGDVSAIETLMLSGVADGLTYVIRILLFGAALFVLAWQLALAALVVAPLFWLATRHFSREIKSASREKRRRSGAVSAVAEESLANAAVVQAYTREASEVSRLMEQGDGAVDAEMESTRLRGLFSLLTDVLELAGGLLVVAVGTWELGQGNLSIGGFVAFLAFVSQLYSPIRRLGQLINTVHGASASAERIIELLDEQPTVVDCSSPRSLGPPAGLIELDGVRFSYPGIARGALHDVSLRVAPGETLAIVGASGAGKSTIAKLALRFYDPDEGRLLIDGIDARELSLADLRRQLALVLQETLIFDGTIKQNIHFGAPNASYRQVLAAALAAGAHDFIADLPDGYDTVVGQRGRRLSGGQRQRIAIARAMVRDAPILILDEPTTGLDAISAERMLTPLRRLMHGRTVLVISHDLSAIRSADSIVVLDHGRVSERGTHDQLLERGGLYTRLWRAQGSRTAEVYRARRMATGELAILGLQLGSATRYMHAEGWLHLDLKPANVIIEAGFAKLLDLSLSRAPGTHRAGIGTRPYLAPEQARGGELSAAADIWGLGALLFDTACARPPFESSEVSRYPQLSRRAPSVRTERRLPTEFAELIDACLHPEPGERPPIDSILETLEKFA